MNKLYNKCCRIYEEKYLKGGYTLMATTEVLGQLQKKLRIIKLRGRSSFKFISRGSHVLFAKSVTYKSNKAARDEYDTGKICTEIGNAVQAIRKFFNQERYRGCVLGFNLGNANHDMAVFIRKINGIYELAHFDPNIGATSNTMDGFVKKLGKTVIRRGYHSLDGNPNGICSYLSWMELLKFVLHGRNPFVTESLLEFDRTKKTYCTRLEIQNSCIERKATRRDYKGKKRTKNRILQRLEN